MSLKQVNESTKQKRNKRQILLVFFGKQEKTQN